ncbi:hypothetical protein [Streptomyces xanthochromogenes]
MTPEELAAKLTRASDQIGPYIVKAVAHTGELGLARIRGGASGRPGPNVITGTYRNSWQSVTTATPYGAQCTIGTNAPQGRRLEFGFVGADARGRVYNQSPFPHVQPALGYIGQTLQSELRLALTEVLL